jgi:hypothetical protein
MASDACVHAALRFQPPAAAAAAAAGRGRVRHGAARAEL